MSLLRLLTAGRSLVGLKDSASRYRESKYRLLPKFGTGTNPFQTKSTTVEPLTATENIATAREQPTPASPAPALTSSTASTELLNHEKQAFDKKGRIARWISSLRARGSRRKETKATRAMPQLAKSPVQGELSLDQVRVMRNDLNDADLEVVASRDSVDSIPAHESVKELEKIERAEAPLEKGHRHLSMAGKL